MDAKEDMFNSQTSSLHFVSGKRERSVSFAVWPLVRVRTPRMRWDAPRERKWEAVSRPIPGCVSHGFFPTMLGLIY